MRLQEFKWFVCLVLIMLAQPAFALSCAMQPVTVETIERAGIVFEGTVAGIESVPASWLKKITDGDRAEKKKIFTFKVTKGWKNAVKGDTVKVMRDTYWDQVFAEGGSYLVIAGKEEGGIFSIGICDYPPSLEHAGETLKLLQEYAQKGITAICQSDVGCKSMECSHFDNDIKSGYKGMCVEGNTGEKMCKCMCMGCH